MGNLLANSGPSSSCYFSRKVLVIVRVLAQRAEAGAPGRLRFVVSPPEARFNSGRLHPGPPFYGSGNSFHLPFLAWVHVTCPSAGALGLILHACCGDSLLNRRQLVPLGQPLCSVGCLRAASPHASQSFPCPGSRAALRAWESV